MRIPSRTIDFSVGDGFVGAKIANEALNFNLHAGERRSGLRNRHQETLSTKDLTTGIEKLVGPFKEKGSDHSAKDMKLWKKSGAEVIQRVGSLEAGITVENSLSHHLSGDRRSPMHEIEKDRVCSDSYFAINFLYDSTSRRSLNSARLEIFILTIQPSSYGDLLTSSGLS